MSHCSVQFVVVVAAVVAVAVVVVVEGDAAALDVRVVRRAARCAARRRSRAPLPVDSPLAKQLFRDQQTL